MKKTQELQNSIEQRVKNEAAAHNDNDVLAESYRLKNRFHHIWSYPSRKQFDNEFHRYLHHIDNKTILDYGCGNGQESIKYLERGAIVFGIDISEAYINNCVQEAKTKGFDSQNFNFAVMDAHKLEFSDNTFDFVAGNGILHHLEPSVAMSEIHRVLKPGGRVLLQEPLDGHPLLKLFRLLTPSARTIDEKPFTSKGLKEIVLKEKWISESFYCGIIEAPVAILTSLIMPKRPDNFLLKIAHKIEYLLNQAYILPSWNQYVLLNLIKK